jgi:hypothetical protein
MNTPWYDEYGASALPLGDLAVLDPPTPLAAAEDLSMANSFSELGSQWIDRIQHGPVFVNGL